MEIFTWLGILFCVSQSAMFSGLNLAFFSISKLELEIESKYGSKEAKKVLAMREDSNLLLTTILWGNVSINVLLALLSNSVLAGVAAFLFSTFVITIFGEIIPQAYFSRNALKMASLLTPIFKIYKFLLLPFTKPTTYVLDRWLGKEEISYMAEHHVEELLRMHINTADSDIDMVEGKGALNFLAIDDLHLWEEGQPIDPRTIIEMPFIDGRPIFPVINDSFIRSIHLPNKKWIVIVNQKRKPKFVLNSDSFIRSYMLDYSTFNPYDHCFEPIVVKDDNYRLGHILPRFKVDVEHKYDDVIDKDIIIFWGKEKHIITGADILGRLLHGIAKRQISAKLKIDTKKPKKKKKVYPDTPTGMENSTETPPDPTPPTEEAPKEPSTN